MTISIHPSIHPSIHLSYLSTCLSVCLSVCRWAGRLICLSVCRVYLYVCRSVSLSIYLPYILIWSTSLYISAANIVASCFRLVTLTLVSRRCVSKPIKPKDCSMNSELRRILGRPRFVCSAQGKNCHSPDEKRTCIRFRYILIFQNWCVLQKGSWKP